MIWLTPAQHDVYEYILSCSENGLPPPTIREIACRTGTQNSLAHRRVIALEKKGYIEREGHGHARSIRLLVKK